MHRAEILPPVLPKLHVLVQGPGVLSVGQSVSLYQHSAILSLTECKACYHKSCFKSTRCPRCERLQARRELMDKQSAETYNSDCDDELEQPEAVAAT